MNEDDKSLETTTENKMLTPLDLQAKELEQMNQYAKQIIVNVDDDRDKTDELYDFMRDQIEVDGDRNPATREAMAKAMELKMKGTDQMIELLKIKAKLINPNKGTAININLGEYDTQRGGDTTDMIDIAQKLKKEFNEK
jgi:hypothetical protein